MVFHRDIPLVCISVVIGLLAVWRHNKPKTKKTAMAARPYESCKIFKGGPEPLEKENHEFLGSKRDDRFSNPFFEMVPKTCQGSFFVPALA